MANGNPRSDLGGDGHAHHGGQRRWLSCIAITATLTLAAAALRAAPCDVPGTHPSLAAAVADTNCTAIVLGAATFPEDSLVLSRDLSIQGTSSTTTRIEGQLRVEGAATRVQLQGLTLDATAGRVAGCLSEALLVEGAQVSSLDVVALSTATPADQGSLCLLFADGFESGDVTAWSQ